MARAWGAGSIRASPKTCSSRGCGFATAAPSILGPLTTMILARKGSWDLDGWILRTRIRECIISHNFATYFGGGVSIDHPRLGTSGSRASACSSRTTREVRWRSGEVSCETAIQSSATIRSGEIPGGAIGIISDGGVVENNIIRRAIDGPHKTHDRIASFGFTTEFRCNDFWNNAAGNTHCGVDGGGNFTQDPLLCGTSPSLPADFGYGRARPARRIPATRAASSERGRWSAGRFPSSIGLGESSKAATAEISR